AAGHHQRGEHLAEGRLLVAPALLEQLGHDTRLLERCNRAIAAQAAAAEAAAQDQMAHPLRMTHGVRDRDRRRTRDAPEREPLETRRVRNGLEVMHPRIERHVVDIALGQTNTPAVIADKRVPARHFEYEVAHNRAYAIVLDMTDPGRHA